MIKVGILPYMVLSFYDYVKKLDVYTQKFYNCADYVLGKAMRLQDNMEEVKFTHDLLCNINKLCIKTVY